jgi:hypothetical protein
MKKQWLETEIDNKNVKLKYVLKKSKTYSMEMAEE